MTGQNQNYHRPGAFLLQLACLSVLGFVWFGLLSLPGCAPPATLEVLPQADFRTYTPPLLISTAQSVLGSPVVNVGIHTFDWSSKRVFVASTRQGKVGAFLEEDGHFLPMTLPSGTGAVNEVLRDFRFTRGDFADARRVWHFLTTVVILCEGAYAPVGSSVFLKALGGPEGVAWWSRHSKKTEAAFRQVCRDPQFVFDGNTWVVTFNVFRVDGGVDQWKVTGEFSPATQSNAIHKVHRSALKKRGTFAYMNIG